MEILLRALEKRNYEECLSISQELGNKAFNTLKNIIFDEKVEINTRKDAMWVLSQIDEEERVAKLLFENFVRGFTPDPDKDIYRFALFSQAKYVLEEMGYSFK